MQCHKRSTLALTVLALCGRFAIATAQCEDPFVDTVLKHNGGYEKLRAISTLRWQGAARIHSERGIVEIGVRTEVHPFDRARSDSWLMAEEPVKARSMIIEGTEGWVERAGQRSPMPQPMLEHERAQFAIYGLMLLATLCDRNTQLSVDANDGALVVAHPKAPKTTLIFDKDYHLTRALNKVPAPDGSGLIDQEFVFSTDSVPGPIHWPRRIEIHQNGRPYFELELREFQVAD